MKQIKVDGHPDLVRDVRSGAVVNKNQQEYTQYIESYRKRQKQNDKVNNIEEELTNLRSEIDEIKDLLRQLISK